LGIDINAHQLTQCETAGQILALIEDRLSD
jgi:hypothetical protein